MISRPFPDHLGAYLDQLRSDLRVNLAFVAGLRGDSVHIFGCSSPSGIRVDVQDDPLSAAVVGHVARMNFPLVVADILSHPLFRDVPGLRQSISGACLGYPVRTSTGRVTAVIAGYCDRLHHWEAGQQQGMAAAAVDVLRYLDG